MVASSVSSSWPLTHSSHCWLLDQVSPEERQEGHKVFKWGSGSSGREQRRAGLLGASRGPRSLVGGGGRLEVQSGGRRGAWPVHRKWTCSQDQEAGSPPGGGSWDWSPRSRKSVRSGGWWGVLVLLSETHQWFGCNIQRPENMEAGSGEGER